LIEQSGFPVFGNYTLTRSQENRMAPRQMKMPEKPELEPEETFSQRKRPETGRFFLQVDRQTKGSYPILETAHAAGLAIKNNYPLLHVTVYDTVEFTHTTIIASATS
jgi:hypothetical protein